MGPADRDRLGRALARARVGFFAYRPDDAAWDWVGADFGIAGIAGADGLARLREAVAPAQRPGLLEALRPTAAPRPPGREFRVQGADGQTLYLALQASLDDASLESGDGRAVFGTVRDVTGPRHVTPDSRDAPRPDPRGDAGEKNHHLVIASLDAGPVSIAIADATQPDLPLIHVNQMFLRMTGYEAAEVIGRNARFLQGPATDPAAVADLRAAIAAGRHIETTLINYRKDGTAFLNRLVLDPIHDEAGTLTGFFAAHLDITNEAAEKAEAGRRARQARERVMDGVAHEMNNLLQPVALLGQDVIDQGLVDDAGRAHFEALVECGKTARLMIDDLLLSARAAGAAVLDAEQQGRTGHGIDPDH